MRISVIAAVDEKLGIGKANGLAWQLSADKKRFKQLTMNHCIVMGRKTYESIGRPLPGRTNIVITGNTDFSAEGCVIVHSLDEALAAARGIEKKLPESEQEIFIIGGGQIYTESMDSVEHPVDRLYLTLVHGDYGCDVFFPAYADRFTREIERQDGAENDITFSYVTLDRNAP